MPRKTATYAFLDAPLPLAFAHRGGAAHGDENTLAAFERAVALGYRYLETDVRCTADGVAVVFHDRSLHRLTGTRRALGDLTWRDLATIRVAGAQAVPRLRDVLGSWPEVRFNIDVKSDPATAPVIDAIRDTASRDRVLIAAFSDARIARIRQAFGPRLATALATREALRLRAAATLGRSMLGFTPGVPVAQLPARIGRFRMVDAALVRYAHRLGIQVHVWTVDDPAEMYGLLDLGVAGIMTDRIDVLREVYVSRGLWQVGDDANHRSLGRRPA